MHRRDVLKLGAKVSAATVASPFIVRSALAQEITNVVLLIQHGLPYTPIMTMSEMKLVEKHAAKAGLPNVKVEYRQLAGTSALIDSLIAGQMHAGVVGLPSIITLWARTSGTPQEVRGLCSVNSTPYMLVTNNKDVKTIRDFSTKDKIALPAVKISAQAVTLQMAVAKEWGDAEYARLDHLTISRAHPEAAAAVMSGNTEINSHFAVSPFYFQEEATPGVRRILKSYDVFGGPASNGLLITTKSFRDQNPKIAGAIVAGLQEAHDFINAHPNDAAEIYLKATNDKKSDRAQLAMMIKDPDHIWTATPQNAMTFATFMHKVGSVKKLATDWKDLFLPEAHALKGS